jgi:hypothetical protein
MVQALAAAVRSAVAELAGQPMTAMIQPTTAHEDISLVTRIQQAWAQPRGKVAFIGGMVAVLAAFGFLLSRLEGNVAILGPEKNITETLTITPQSQVASPTTENPTATQLLTTSLSPQAKQACILPSADLIAWWPGEGDTRDIVGGNDGTLTGGLNFDAGKVGQAFRFDGVDDSLNVPNKNDVFDLGEQFTIDFWMKADPDNPMKDCCQGLVATDFYVLELMERGMQFAIYDEATGGLESIVPTVALFLPDTWYHITGVYDGIEARTYVNGVLNYVYTISSTVPIPIKPMLDGTEFGDSFLAIGSEEGRYNEPYLNYNRYFKGLIDEVAIYKRALNETEIQTLFAAGSAGKCAPSDSALTPTLSTQAEQARAFAEPILRAVKDLPPDFQDDFSRQSDWGFNTGPHRDKGRMEIVDGVLRLNVTSSADTAEVGFATHPRLHFNNFVLSVEANLRGLVEGNGLLQIAWRGGEDGAGVVFWLRSDGEWRIAFCGSCDPDLAYGRQLIDISNPVSITVISRETEYVVALNGAPIAYVNDAGRQPGMPIQLILWVPEGVHDATVEYDNLRVWNLDNVPGLP